MNKQVIKSDSAPAAIGPYSQAVKFGDMYFLSGQIPIEPSAGKITVFTIEEQTHQVLKNIKSLLADNKMTLANVLKTTVFVKNIEDFMKINEIYSQYFTENYPARSLVEVSRLPKDALIEIECICAD